MRRKSSPATITFSCDPDWHGVLTDPVPAAKAIPDWFKRLGIPIPMEGELPAQTIKSCMPVLDAFQAGYMLLTTAPVRFIVTDDNIRTAWRSDEQPMIASHSAEQIAGSGWPVPALKWLNPWMIKTAPGYSCFITHPVNRLELPFTTLTGLVDTDEYPNQINFPFIWTGERPYDDIVPAGTPIAQVIPFRREQVSMDVRPMTEAEQVERGKAIRRLNLRNHGYRENWRKIKHWRSSALS